MYVYMYYYYYYSGYCVLASLCFIIYVQLLLGVLIAGSFVQLGRAALLVSAHTSLSLVTLVCVLFLLPLFFTF